MKIKKIRKKKAASVIAAALVLFLAGNGAASLTHQCLNNFSPKKEQVENWGLGFGAEGTQPSGNATPEELKEYDAHYIGDAKKKVLYLTFDCGYENGNTEKIMAALKKHNAPATFFVVGNFLETSPELVKKMVKEGYTVGNHTYHHPDMSSISDKASFQKELEGVSNLYKEITGKEMTKYYRPPQGKYSTENLKMAKELGYQTLPMWTGMWMRSRQRKKHLTNCCQEFIRVRSYCCIIHLRQMGKYSMNC